MWLNRILVTAFVLAASVVSHISNAQTSTTSTTGTNTTATATAASSQSEAKYVSRIAPRFGKLAGSSDNLESLVHGLRTGSEVKLTSIAATPGASTTSSTSGDTSASFTPATRPMGYGNISRTLDLANKQLAAAGITNPTPQELASALNGGTVKSAQGSTTFDGVLKLRSEGMGWGKIAKTIGVHPGMGKAENHASGQPTGNSGSPGARIATAGGASSNSGKKVATASGASTQAGKGIVTAGGAPSSHRSGHGSKLQTGTGVVTANGAAARAGVTTGHGSGRGNGGGAGGKH